MDKVIQRFVSVVLVILSVQSISAQVSGGYWGNQYGSRGFLLNGAVIASVDDETAIFYNPGALGLSDKFGVSVSLITPTFNFIKTNDLLGDGSRFTDKGLGLAPGLVAAEIEPFGTEKINVGFTIFERFRSKVHYDERVVNEIPKDNDMLFVGELEYDRDFSETWVGIGASLELHNRLSVGISQFITWRGERVDLNFKKEFIDRNDPNNLLASWRSQFRYSYGANAGIISKVGLSWRPFNMKIGLTYTSRTYGLILRGADYKYSDARLSSNGAQLRSNKRDVELNKYRTPWSLGFGLEFKIKKTLISVSAEYFEELEAFDIIDDTDDPLEGLSPGSEPVRTVVTLGNNDVLNVALGIERILNRNYSLFLAGRTDFSPKTVLNIGEGISFLSTDPDRFHISMGGTYLYKRSKFSIGVDYGFGFKTGGRQLIDLNDVNEENVFKLSGKDVVDTHVHSMALFITYNL